ncbi:Alpha/Beta hydrolase protein [Aspergillus heterothallicus]
MASTITPFKVEVPSEEILRLRGKLEGTRIPQHSIVPQAESDYGPPLEWFHRLYQKWINEFDWIAVQQHLNRHPHFLAHIQDEGHNLDIHFTHVVSQRKNAIPLLLIHGWPGSFYEFDRVVDQFVAPESSTDAAFSVVVPSLPGFCWSSNPPRRGWTLQDNARVLDHLMGLLGYDSYVVQAGDWGSFVARELGSKYRRCKAVHLNFSPATEDLPSQSDSEKRRAERSQDWLDNHLGYAVCMRTRPQTLGFALSDNPIGILSWVGEKYHELVAPARWNDPEWDHIILTQVSLYYFTDCIMPSMLPYYENVKHAEFAKYFMKEENKVKVPLAYTSFLYDSRPGNQRSASQTGNLKFYNEFDEGGHFAALECPDIILRDCRKFFQDV